MYERLQSQGLTPNSTTYNALITAYGKACNLPAVRIIPLTRVSRFSLLSTSLCSLTTERVVSSTRGVPFLFHLKYLLEPGCGALRCFTRAQGDQTRAP